MKAIRDPRWIDEEFCGVVTRYPVIPEGHTLVELVHLSHTTCPYDYYARMLKKRLRMFLLRSGMCDCPIHICPRELTSAHGSGPEGRERFGDRMTPPAVLVEVRDNAKASLLRQKWAEHENRQGLRKPFSVVGSTWWDTSTRKWVAVGAWSRVVDNAICVAESLKVSADRLAALKLYRDRIQASP